MADKSDASRFLSSGSSSVLKAYNQSTLHRSQDDSFADMSSSSSSGKTKNYSSATEALQAYISDFENSNPSYRVAVAGPPKSTLQSLNASSSAKAEINRYKVKKLIDRSYREILRADKERHKAKVLLRASRMNDSNSAVSSQVTETSLNTDALLSAPPYPTRRSRNSLSRVKSGSLEDLASRRVPAPKRMAASYHTPCTIRQSTPSKVERSSQSTSPGYGGRPAPSWIDDLESVKGHPAPSWLHDLDSSGIHPVPSWIQELDAGSCSAPTWVQDLDTSNISTITQGSLQRWNDASRISHKVQQPGEDSVLLKRYGSTSDLLLSDASDWPLEEAESFRDLDLGGEQSLQQRYHSDESKILATPEKRDLGHAFRQKKTYTDEIPRYGRYKDDSSIVSRVGKRLDFKYRTYSRDDSDLASSSHFSKRSHLKRPKHYVANTSSPKRILGNEHSKINRSSRRYGASLSRSRHDLGGDIASMDTDMLVNQAPLPTVLNSSRDTDADTTLNDTLIAEVLAKARRKAHIDLNTSPLTEDVLDGDRSWEKTTPLRKYQRTGVERTPVQVPGKTGIIDKFLEDCLHSDRENEQGSGSSPRLTGGEQPGPVETLKKMLFKLQSVAADENDPDDVSEERHPPLQSSAIEKIEKAKFDIEPGGLSLQRAMEHLSRLKTLVYSDSETASQKSTSSTNSSKR